MATAIVMMTHRFDTVVVNEFERMRAALGPQDRAFLLSDGSAPAPTALAPVTHTFEYANVAKRAVRVIGDDILRNVHLAWLDFFDAHPGFDNYWIIEYDVRFSGAWSELFDAFRELPFDLLCPHLRHYAEEPAWGWWHAVRRSGEPIARENMLRGFLPIVRLSRRGFECLRDGVANGWNGFLEGMIPTLLHSSGLSVADIGGDGSFVPEGFQNRFYTSSHNQQGSLYNVGSMRYREAIPFPRIFPGRLYHPVKPESCFMDAGVGAPHQVCLALAKAFASIRKRRRLLEEQNARDEIPADYLLHFMTGHGADELFTVLTLLQNKNGTDLTTTDLPVALLRNELLALLASPHEGSATAKIAEPAP